VAREEEKMEAKAKRGFSLTQESLPVIIFFGVIAIVMIVFSTLSPYFFTPGNLLTALKHLSTISLAALGLTFVLAVGKSDMSFHFISCLAGITMAYFIKLGWSPVPAIIMGVLIALVFGLIDGLAVGKFKLPDMIVTIAIGSVAWGMSFLYSGGTYIYENFLTSGIIQFADGKLFGIPYPVIYIFTAYIISYVVLHRTRFGRNFFAVGSNPIAARFSGVKVERYIVIAFLLCVGLAAFDNMILVAAQGNGNVKGGQVLLMPAWAAVFVGISIFRKPSVIGTFLGAFLMAIMQNGFTLLNSPFYIMDLIVGSTLVGALLISRIQIKRKVHDDSLPTATPAQAPAK
jgi:ribose transport system permease protein